MTRINLIPPRELDTRHLLAEYRELPRVFRLAIAAYGRDKDALFFKIPKAYTMGRGHVLFFYDKLVFCAWRHNDLKIELRNRGYFNLTLPDMYDGYALIAPPPLWNDYQPTPEAIAINQQRIDERLIAMRQKESAA